MANNNKTKAKKKKKQMSEQTRRTLGNTFKSILSNQACVDGGKEAPWWIAVIFLVLAICLPVIPITVSYSKAYGSSFIAGANYDSDRGLVKTTEYLHANGYELKVEGGDMQYYKDGNIIEGSDEAIASDIYENTVSNIKYYNFQFYITDKAGGDLTTFVESLTKKQYLVGTTTPYTSAHEAAGQSYYTPSFIIFSHDTVAMRAYKVQSKDAGTTSLGGYSWVNVGNGDILAKILNVNAELTGSARTKAIFDNWKVFFNDAYMYQRNIQMRNMSLIYLGVYAGLILFLGLMIFLLTRGKNNMFHFLNIWTCEKIAWWASFTPAVLAMILGFIFSTNVLGQMSFIVLVSIRVMWLSMRQLRPLQ